jgi:hypothetical protein
MSSQTTEKRKMIIQFVPHTIMRKSLMVVRAKKNQGSAGAKHKLNEHLCMKESCGSEFYWILYVTVFFLFAWVPKRMTGIERCA